MGTVARQRITQETTEARFRRLREEARHETPESVGSPEQIKQDTLRSFTAWRKNRRRANKIA